MACTSLDGHLDCRPEARLFCHMRSAWVTGHPDPHAGSAQVRMSGSRRSACQAVAWAMSDITSLPPARGAAARMAKRACHQPACQSGAPGRVRWPR